MNKSWILFSLLNFLTAAIMGLILRGAFVWGADWLDYRNMMHGHSHVAMLGWVYLALYILIGSQFIPAEQWKKPVYAWLFWLTQFTVVGMMISFPLQGYGAVSITFSTLHILESYVFVYLVWRDHRRTQPELSLLIKTSLVLMVLSTVAIWSLGPLVIWGGTGSIWYQLAIQFFLHFQFYGWFTMAVLALLLEVVTRNSSLSTATFKKFYCMLLLSVFLTYGLVLAWGFGGAIPLLVNGMGLLSQLIALGYFYKTILHSNPQFFQQLSPSIKVLYQFGMASWIAKVTIQTIVIIPEAAVVSFTIRSLMIGFVHLTMLGFVSGLLFALILGADKLVSDSSWAFAGRGAFIAGFVLTELLLFVQGLCYWFQWGQLPAFYELLFGASALLPLSIFLLLVSIAKYYKGELKNQLITT